MQEVTPSAISAKELRVSPLEALSQKASRAARSMGYGAEEQFVLGSPSEDTFRAGMFRRYQTTFGLFAGIWIANTAGEKKKAK